MIADVDCTDSGGEQVCSDYGVQGYPTIKYFTDETGKKGKDYDGGRDFNELNDFVKENLAKKCDPETKENCDEQESKYADKFKSKGADAIAAELARLEGLTGSSMKEDKRIWLVKRIAILKQFGGGKGEL